MTSQGQGLGAKGRNGTTIRRRERVEQTFGALPCGSCPRIHDDLGALPAPAFASGLPGSRAISC